MTTINVLIPHNHGFLCGALRGNVTSLKTFEAFNVASPCLGTSLRGGFLYCLTFEGVAPTVPWVWSFLR